MAMLAEPRQRKRYNLVPRGKALYEDDNRFGTKMLQKMGWSKGNGLGANEDGSKDFVRIRYKNDANGLGYEDRDDQWTQHEESFNGLLKSLHGEEVCANDANNVANDAENTITTVGFGFQSEPKRKKLKLKEKFSGESLEEKSKNSKARVHYKKFTRGKDLSRYSEKDLANIFGKKDAEDQATNATYEQFQAFKIDNEEVQEELEIKSNFAGVPTINTGLSVSDYFKQKMEAMKNKIKSSAENETKCIEAVEDESSDCIQESKKKKKKQKRAYNEETEETTEVENVTKRKKKREQDEEESLLLNIEQNLEEGLKNETSSSRKRIKEEKRKAKKVNQNSLAPIVKENSNETIEETPQNNKNCDNCITENSTLKFEIKKSKKPKSENMKLDKMVINENETSTKINKQSKKNSEESKESLTCESLSTSESTYQKPKNTKEYINDIKEKLNVDINGHDASELNAAKTNNISSKKKYKEELTLEDLKAELNSYNIYQISTFCAEKFSNTDLTCFVGSTLSAIVGYSLSDQLQLDIKAIRGDQQRITMLWNSKINKYDNSKYRKNYKKYMSEAHTIRKTKKKVPRISLKVFKRKDAFTGI